MRKPVAFIVVATLGLLAVDCGALAGETAADDCRRMVTDDTLRPVPDSLMPAVEQVFGLAAPIHRARPFIDAQAAT